MFVVPCFIAVLSGRHISDVLRPFETKAQAIAQCQAWTHATRALKEEQVPGYVFFATYSGAADTVRVEQHLLELDDAHGEEDNETETEGVVVLNELRSLTRSTKGAAADSEVDA